MIQTSLLVVLYFLRWVGIVPLTSYQFVLCAQPIYRKLIGTLGLVYDRKDLDSFSRWSFFGILVQRFKDVVVIKNSCEVVVKKIWILIDSSRCRKINHDSFFESADVVINNGINLGESANAGTSYPGASHRLFR